MLMCIYVGAGKVCLVLCASVQVVYTFKEEQINPGLAKILLTRRSSTVLFQDISYKLSGTHVNLHTAKFTCDPFYADVVYIIGQVNR